MALFDMIRELSKYPDGRVESAQRTEEGWEIKYKHDDGSVSTVETTTEGKKDDTV